MSHNNVADERRGSNDVGGGRHLIPPRARGRTRARVRARPARPGPPPPPSPPPHHRRSYVLVRGPGDPQQHPSPVAPSPDRCGGGGGGGGDGAESESGGISGRNDPPPPPLSLRLPASFLSALPSGSRLELRGGGGGGGDHSTGSNHPASLVVVPAADLAQVDGDGDGAGADRGAVRHISVAKEIRRQHEAVARSVVEVFRSSTPPPPAEGSVARTPSSVVGGTRPGGREAAQEVGGDGGDVQLVQHQRLFLSGAVSARYEAVRAEGRQREEEGGKSEGASFTPATSATVAGTPATVSRAGAKGIDVAALGRRTRRRADEERRKRKEIVRLVDHDHVGGGGDTATKGEGGESGVSGDEDDDDKEPSTFLSGVGTAPPKKRAKRKDAGGAAEKPPTKEKTTKQTRKRGRRQPSSTRGRGENTDYDGWMPTPPHGHSYPDSNHTPAIGTRSDVVRVHGLPVGTRPEHVRKFFSGLDVSGVYVLPPCPCPSAFRLEGFDAEEPPPQAAPPASSTRGTGRRRPRRPPPKTVVGPTIEREPECLRVIVRFASEAAASLAVDRTGEVVVIPEKTSTTTGTSGTSAAAAVLVTAIPRSAATFVLRNMAIEAVPGRPLSETAREAETELHLPTEAIDAVWAAALSSPESGLRPPPPSAWGAKADPPFGKGDGGDDAEDRGDRMGTDDLTRRSIDIRRRVAACSSDDDNIMGRLVEYREALSDRLGDLESWWAVSHIPHPTCTSPVAPSPSRGSTPQCLSGAGKTEESVRRVVASGIRWLRREMEDVDVVLRQLREVTLLP